MDVPIIPAGAVHLSRAMRIPAQLSGANKTTVFTPYRQYRQYRHGISGNGGMAAGDVAMLMAAWRRAHGDDDMAALWAGIHCAYGAMGRPRVPKPGALPQHREPSDSTVCNAKIHTRCGWIDARGG